MSKQDFTHGEIAETMRNMQQVFDLVRLVDPYHTHTCRINENGELEEEPFQCHSVWNREARCSNCISLQVMAERRRMTKFEFMGDDVYYVVSKYVTVDGKPCAMEMVANVTDELMLDAYGKDALVRAIRQHNRKLYRDALTGAYNRNYYEEQLKVIAAGSGVAMIDVDNFKSVNDTYGHDVGDEVLHGIAEAILKSIRTVDVLVRYGGDEFFLMVTDITAQALRDKLSGLPALVSSLRFPKYPELRASVSVGAAWFPEAHSTEECMKKADEALYAAKREKNCIRFA